MAKVGDESKIQDLIFEYRILEIECKQGDVSRQALAEAAYDVAEAYLDANPDHTTRPGETNARQESGFAIRSICASHPSITQERFFQQHFVGKRFIYDPSFPSHYAVFSDGTAVRANVSDYDEPCDMRMSEQQGTGVIAKAYFDIEEVGYYTDTYSLYVEYEGDPTPHLIAQESFPYEPFGDNEVLSLVALDEDDL